MDKQVIKVQEKKQNKTKWTNNYKKTNKQNLQTTQHTQIALKSVQNTNPSKHMPYNSHTSNEV